MTLLILFALRAQFLMGTVCEISAANPEPAFSEARRIEAMISTWRDDSELSRLNRGEITTPSPELEALLREAMTISRETDGAFDPLIRPLIDVWGTRERSAAGTAAGPQASRLRRRDGAAPAGEDAGAPSAAAVMEAVRRANPKNVAFAGGTIALANGALFDEGGFGKGYALDRMLALTKGDAVINFGGQIAVRGKYEVAIAHPLHRDRPLITLTLRNASLSTSSDSERPGHIIDPATGKSVPSWGSASVIDPSAFRADALSTALYVMGPKRGLAWARAHDVTAIFITERGEITWSRKP